jgi:hypothetical protein
VNSIAHDSIDGSTMPITPGDERPRPRRSALAYTSAPSGM